MPRNETKTSHVLHRFVAYRDSKLVEDLTDKYKNLKWRMQRSVEEMAALGLEIKEADIFPVWSGKVYDDNGNGIVLFDLNSDRNVRAERDALLDAVRTLKLEAETAKLKAARPANDTVRLAAEQAVTSFGGKDGTFNAAGFGQAISRIAGVSNSMDGKVVRAVLAGRPDVVPLRGSHYKLIDVA